MNEKQVALYLTKELLKRKFIVHKYNAYSTSSIYLKLDYGVSCGIRISDHPGRKKYHYRFNVIKDYKGNKAVTRDGLISYFYNFNELDEVVDAVQKEKQSKVADYGIENYKVYMKRNANQRIYREFEKLKGVA